MSKEKNFGYLGNTFQLQILNNIILYKDFASSIVDVLEPKYFDNQYFKLIMQMTKEYYHKYEHAPSFSTLEQITKSEVSSPMAQKMVLDMITQVVDAPEDGYQYVQEKALKFCKQQELQKVMTKAQKIIDKGDFESYDHLEEMVREALQVGEVDTGTADVFFNLDEVLDDDFRHPIPLGITGIDNLLKGGLAKGEIGVILAPTGVGKTTVLSKIANNAFNLGYNVLQIFFEDNPKIIQRKHFTMWTKIAPDNLSVYKEDVLEKVRQIKENAPNRLILKKLPSDTLTMNQIKNQMRKMIAEGIKLDLVVVDYIDCIVPDKNLGDEWKSEGSVMRGFESMCHELDIAGWTATQGNRSSISSEVVTTDQMGGSIKKAQVGHVIISIAKSLQQKEMNLATIAITKSRIGKDGIVFENCKFDNEMIEIDTDSSVTFLGMEEQKEEKNKVRIQELLQKRKQRESKI
jgi:replicative DNA helicase|tara:strand:- start:1810 stop:3189 length:1380 start_codon:yes stop_codon:yes gene_type:complete